MFPVIDLAGEPHERGVTYGTTAREQVRSSIAGYAAVFAHYATWDWAKAVQTARDFLPAITDFGPQYVEEMRGIAAGAEVDFEDVLAINLRTEIMFAAKARAAGARLPAVGECSSFGAVDAADRVIAGQNWDWLPQAAATVVVLRVQPSSGPAYVTVVEGGLLAKFGVNSAGLAVMTNALVSSEDAGEPGVPYHLLLRGLLDCQSPRQAVSLLQNARRASSANYLIAHESGLVFDLEARPGGLGRLHHLDPDDRGVVLHTNHFRSPDFDAVDVGWSLMADSRLRLQRLHRATLKGDPHSLATYEAALADHAGHPDSVCCHPDPTEPNPLEQGLTVTGALVDVATRSLRISHGPVCGGFETVDTTFLNS